jgi:hypothetical protein
VIVVVSSCGFHSSGLAYLLRLPLQWPLFDSATLRCTLIVNSRAIVAQSARLLSVPPLTLRLCSGRDRLDRATWFSSER